MGRSWVSLSCGASVFTALYMSTAILNLYRLMNPLTFIDIKSFPPEDFVNPLWEKESPLDMQVYLSSREDFSIDFLRSGFSIQDAQDTSRNDVKLLWETSIASASLAKSFLITTLNCNDDSEVSKCLEDVSYKYASTRLDDAENMANEQKGGIVSALSSAGGGIESTSVLLTIYVSFKEQVGRLLTLVGFSSETEIAEKNAAAVDAPQRTIITLPTTSPLWSAVRRNETLHVHVVLKRKSLTDTGIPPETYEDAAQSLMGAQKSNSLLLGHVNLFKYDEPHHIEKPRRLLFHDLQYLWKRYLLRSISDSTPSPWDVAHANPKAYATYQRALEMIAEGSGYPYFKPEVSVKFVYDDVKYPMDYVHASGMQLVNTGNKSQTHPTGIAHVPGMHVDEMGLTSEKYIPVNETLTSLPLRISFDRSDIISEKVQNTATAGGISPARWRLLTHLSSSIESQKQLGFEQSDIDDLKRMIADTNVTLLTITILASALHLLFEFLTFKSEVSFWRQNKDLTGLSVRSLFLDMLSQLVILMFLIEKDSSLLMTIPTACGCAIALWKCQRGAGFKFVLAGDVPAGQKTPWWNIVPRMIGYELRATRLEIHNTKGKTNEENEEPSNNLAALTIETDRNATRILGSVMLPIVLAYTLYSFIQEEHHGWYSWLITSASTAVYALGFVLMTPQLFLNYKMKSVAHLPWRVLCYKFLNTFIDDLFAFIIRMPTMARISCFRDDIVFFVYLYQRWLYDVDESRPVEGADGPTSAPKESTEKKNQ